MVPQLTNDDSSANESGNSLVGLLPPAKRKEMGRPTSREKALYEGLSIRTRFSTICRHQGHKQTTCPDRREMSQSKFGDQHAARIVELKVTVASRNNCHKAAELIRLNKA